MWDQPGVRKARFRVEVEVSWYQESVEQLGPSDPWDMIHQRIELASMDNFYGDRYDCKVIALEELDSEETTGDE